MEKGTNGLLSAPSGVQNLLSLRVEVFQSSRLAMVYPSVTLFGFSADVGRTQRVPPTSVTLQEEVLRFSLHQQRGGPAWSHSDTKAFSTGVSEGVEDTSVESLLHSFVGSQRASIRLASVCRRPAMPFEFQRLHYDGSFQGSSQSKGKSSDKGQTLEECEKSGFLPLVGALVRVAPLWRALPLLVLAL